MDSTADLSRLCRTKMWVESHCQADRESPRRTAFSPVTNLSFQLSAQSFNDNNTPKRRLSLDTESSTGGTPTSLLLSTVEPLCNAPTISTDVASKFEFTLDSPSNFVARRGEKDRSRLLTEMTPEDLEVRSFTALQTKVSPLFSNLSDSNKENFPFTLPSVSSTDCSRSLVPPSPCPSSVFVDEDSQDSGFSEHPDSNNKAKSAVRFVCPIGPPLRHRSKPSVTSTIFENDLDVGFFDQMEIGGSDDNKMDIGGFAFGGDINPSVIFGSKTTISTTASSGDTIATETPVKGSSIWRCPSATRVPLRRVNSVANDSGMGGMKRNQRSPDSPSSPAVSRLKRPRNSKGENSLDVPSRFHRCYSETELGIASALQKCHNNEDLIGDFTRPHILPINKQGKVSDLKSINCDTLRDLLDGKYNTQYYRCHIIDCRYPYEYEGGHIAGASNIYLKEDLMMLYFGENLAQDPSQNHIFVFYCEFSSERGPGMARYLRQVDRELNRENYPKLNYPEVYLLDGGYKNFFAQCQDKCVPMTYKTMADKNHSDDLRHFRAKSKSWCGPDPCRTGRSAARTGLRFQ